MTVPSTFVNSLRTRGQPFKLGAPSDQPLRLRAQVLEAWDAIPIEANPSASIRRLKHTALRELYSDEQHDDDYVVKLNGFEILDKDAPISSTAARNGAT